MKLKEKRIMSYFIESTQEIISEEGVEGVTIKKIGERSGYNSATLYNYFKNLDVLLIYASIKFLKDYIVELKRDLKNIKDPIERYIEVYRVFNLHSFKYPDIYFNMFYGRYSNMLPEIIDDYYKIFPEEILEDNNEDIDKMLRQGNIYKRDYEITKDFISKGYTEDDIEIIINATIRIHSSYLYDVIYNNEIDKKKHSDEFLKFILSLIKRLGVKNDKSFWWI